MSFNLFKNDKSTFVDEIIMAIMIVVTIGIGVLLIKFHPSFWIISESDTIVFGMIVAVFGFMFVPALIYRLFTNDKSGKGGE